MRLRWRNIATILGLLACLTLLPVPGHAQWKKILGELTKKSDSGLSDEKIGRGLKEALRIGTRNATRETGRRDGFLGNDIIRIPLPPKLRKMDKALRTIGQGDKIDEFVVSLNRAAERAAPAAREIFWDAILSMTFSDVKKIFKGGDTAATDFFRDKTTGHLSEAFLPIVQEATEAVGVTRQYKQLSGTANSIPFVKIKLVDIDEYVVEKALDGLFYVLGEEEKKIRKNPAARVTDLLKEVFGRK